MKTIETVAFERYKSDQSLPEHKRLNPSNYIDWANFGKREAQRWIPVEEEMPKVGETVLVSLSGAGNDLRLAFINVRHNFIISLLNNFESEHITHWRPIERS